MERLFNSWRIEFFKLKNGRAPVLEYLEELDERYRAKVVAHIELLREKGGHLYEPYAKHIKGPLWELRIDFGRLASRIFYLLGPQKMIVLLHAFMKKTQKTPRREIETALRYLIEYNEMK